jgi:hypothetical protein
MIRLTSLLKEIDNSVDVNALAQEFMNSTSYNKSHDCKRSTYEFVKWVKKNKNFEPDVILMAPPKDIKKYPGKSGEGDAHIFAIVNRYGIDFTANQFNGVNDPLKITEENKIKSEYKKIGGYFTNFPEWFENGKTSIKTKIGQLPKWFIEGAESEGFKPSDI